MVRLRSRPQLHAGHRATAPAARCRPCRRPCRRRLRSRRSGRGSCARACRARAVRRSSVSAANPTTKGRCGPAANARQDVDRACQSRDVERLGAVFLIFCRPVAGPIVRHRRGADEDVRARHFTPAPLQHVGGALHVDAAHAGGVARLTGPLTSTTSAPAALRGLRHREAHLAAAAIADEAHRIDAFARRPRGDQHAHRPVTAAPPHPAASATCSARSSGSSMRPSPTSPQAWSPSPGPQIAHAARNAACRHSACVAALAHIWRFMAGATATGADVARQTVC